MVVYCSIRLLYIDQLSDVTTVANYDITTSSYWFNYKLFIQSESRPFIQKRTGNWGILSIYISSSIVLGYFLRVLVVYKNINDEGFDPLNWSDNMMQGHILNRKYMNTKKQHEFQHLILVLRIQNNLYKLKSNKQNFKRLFCTDNPVLNTMF